MASKNVQIKFRGEEGGFDDIFPKTTIELIDGLGDILGAKVDVVAGKQLSTNDFTTIETNKLDGVDVGANTYTHPSTHSADIIVETSTKKFVSESEKSLWSGKQDKLSYTPESVSNKGKSGGYAELDSNAKIPLTQLPDMAKSQTFIVKNTVERDSASGMKAGDKAYETETGDSYIYDGNLWLILAKANWENVNLQWANINSKPTSTVANIDDSVSKRHAHSNITTLDKIVASGEQGSFDLSKFVTESELVELGNGDMQKSVYDKNNSGIVDNSEKVNGFTVQTDVPVGAKFTDTIYTHPSTHPASIIVESATKRFATDAEKLIWNGKSKISIGRLAPSADVDIWLEEV